MCQNRSPARSRRAGRCSDAGAIDTINKTPAAFPQRVLPSTRQAAVYGVGFAEPLGEKFFKLCRK